MVYRFGVLLTVVIYVSSSTALPPCVCTRNIKPVCGSDGVTYANECLLRCQKQNNVELTVVKEEECNAQPPCVCTLEYAPVCGTNGVTYPNKCSLTCERGDIEIAYRGACRVKREEVKVNQSPPCLCTREARLVCGTDGHTYSNPCMLNCAKQTNGDLQLDHYGKCDKVGVDKTAQGCSCTRQMSTVCASNGVTYNNICLMKCAGNDLTVERDGPCGSA